MQFLLQVGGVYSELYDVSQGIVEPDILQHVNN